LLFLYKEPRGEELDLLSESWDVEEAVEVEAYSSPKATSSNCSGLPMLAMMAATCSWLIKVDCPAFSFSLNNSAYTVLNVIDDFFPAFLIGKMVAEAFYIFFQFLICRLFNGDYPALEVDIDYFVHGD